VTPFRAAFAALPEGAFRGVSGGRRYRVVKERLLAGRAWKLRAWEIGGPDYISLHLYDLSAGPALRPCEMSKGKVVDFVMGLRVTGPDGPGHMLG